MPFLFALFLFGKCSKAGCVKGEKSQFRPHSGNHTKWGIMENSPG